MALVLGYDGKIAALQAGTGQSVSALGTIYVGLLSALPANYDGLTLTTLLDAGGADNELSATAGTGFYDPTADRIAIPGLSSITADETGSLLSNTGADISWTNGTGGSVTVNGLFITNSSAPANDGSGKVLWVGVPTIGSLAFNDGESLTISAGDLTLKID